jgi:hypothetical protein
MIKMIEPKKLELEFEGYYREEFLPLKKKHNCSGIYVVYAGSRMARGCYLRKLLYIGESENAAKRPGKEHEKYAEWKKELKEGELLYFTFSDVPSADRKRAEAALIYYNEPCCNEQNKDSFNYSKTHIKTSGDAYMLEETFTVP